MGFDWELFLLSLIKKGIIAKSYVEHRNLLDREHILKYGSGEYFGLMILIFESYIDKETELQKEREKLEIASNFIASICQDSLCKDFKGGRFCECISCEANEILEKLKTWRVANGV